MAWNGLRTVLIGTALLAADVGSAEADESSRLAALLADVTSFRSQFEQTVLSRFGEALQTTTGSLHWQQPGRLRWEVDDPYAQLLLADGESLWIFDPDLEQVTVQPLAEAIEGSPAMLLTGLASDMLPHFAVRTAQPPPASGGVRFVLEPRDDTSIFRDATLTFSPDGVLAALDIVDHLDQITRIAFAEATVNPALDPQLFVFDVPAGVDIVGDLPTTATTTATDSGL